MCCVGRERGAVRGVGGHRNTGTRRPPPPVREATPWCARAARHLAAALRRHAAAVRQHRRVTQQLSGGPSSPVQIAPWSWVRSWERPSRASHRWKAAEPAGSPVLGESPTKLRGRAGVGGQQCRCERRPPRRGARRSVPVGERAPPPWDSVAAPGQLACCVALRCAGQHCAGRRLHSQAVLQVAGPRGPHVVAVCGKLHALCVVSPGGVPQAHAAHAGPEAGGEAARARRRAAGRVGDAHGCRGTAGCGSCERCTSRVVAGEALDQRLCRAAVRVARLPVGRQ